MIKFIAISCHYCCTFNQVGSRRGLCFVTFIQGKNYRLHLRRHSRIIFALSLSKLVAVLCVIAGKTIIMATATVKQPRYYLTAEIKGLGRRKLFTFHCFNAIKIFLRIIVPLTTGGLSCLLKER